MLQPLTRGTQARSPAVGVASSQACLPALVWGFRANPLPHRNSGTGVEHRGHHKGQLNTPGVAHLFEFGAGDRGAGYRAAQHMFNQKCRGGRGRRFGKKKSWWTVAGTVDCGPIVHTTAKLLQQTVQWCTRGGNAWEAVGRAPRQLVDIVLVCHPLSLRHPFTQTKISRLATDYATDCTSDSYAAHQRSSIAFLFIYGLGIPVTLVSTGTFLRATRGEDVCVSESDGSGQGLSVETSGSGHRLQPIRKGVLRQRP